MIYQDVLNNGGVISHMNLNFIDNDTLNNLDSNFTFDNSKRELNQPTIDFITYNNLDKLSNMLAFRYKDRWEHLYQTSVLKYNANVSHETNVVNNSQQDHNNNIKTGVNNKESSFDTNDLITTSGNENNTDNTAHVVNNGSSNEKTIDNTNIKTDYNKSISLKNFYDIINTDIKNTIFKLI